MLNTVPGCTDSVIEFGDVGKQLPELGEELEEACLRAMQSFRKALEEAVTQHMNALRDMQAAHSGQVAALRAENAMLRDHCAPVLFQMGIVTEDTASMSMRRSKSGIDAAILAKHGAKKMSRRRSSASLQERSDDFTGKLAKARAAEEAAAQADGSWQHIVAWVPLPASTAGQPDPWKPLLPGSGVQPPNLQVGMAPPTTPPFLGIVPGSVPDEVEEEDEVESETGEKKKNLFEVLEGWQETEEPGSEDSSQLGAKEDASQDGAHKHKAPTPDIHALEAVFEEGPRARCIIHPHSRKRIMWDLMSLSMVMYDMVMIPMGAFTLDENATFLVMMDWTTRAFWTLDIGWSLLTGVLLPDGTVEYSFMFILRRYLKTWFLLDVLIVGSDWMMVGFSASAFKGMSRFTRVFRMFRSIRLLRLLRMKEVVQAITERVQSDKVTFVLMLMKIVVFLVAVSHVTACCWWAIGASTSGSSSWVSLWEYDERDVPDQYMVSLHWSLTQFTGGMDEITPGSAGERLYSVVLWIFGFLAALVLTGIVTSDMTQQHIIGGSRARQMATLRKYLNQNGISSNLALRMQRSAQHAVSGDLSADAVELLTVVSEPLRIEMHFEMYSPVLKNHTFFMEYIKREPQVMRRVCHNAMSSIVLSKEDVVFSKGEAPSDPKMYFVIKGQLEYIHGGDKAHSLHDGQSIGEVALWTKWKHRGTLTSQSDTKLAMLDSKAFNSVASRFIEGGGFNPRKHASRFVAQLNAMLEKQEEVTDLVTMNKWIA